MMAKRVSFFPVFFCAALFAGHTASAHPHVFIDGGINLRMGDENILKALEATFLRRLTSPLDISRHSIDLAFYESTYFFAFSLTDEPKIQGPSTCAAKIIHFEADQGASGLMEMLAKLGREETSGIDNVGALFADRIMVECV